MSWAYLEFPRRKIRSCVFHRPTQMDRSEKRKAQAIDENGRQHSSRAAKLPKTEESSDRTLLQSHEQLPNVSTSVDSSETGRLPNQARDEPPLDFWLKGKDKCNNTPSPCPF